MFAQYKHSGGIRVAGLGLGTYHGGWKALFQPSLDAFKQLVALSIGDLSPSSVENGSPIARRIRGAFA